jgi:transcriptional regulator with XRE-family HTH domain
MITSSQLRAARALMDLSIKELSDLSNVSVPTIQRLERQTGVISSQPRTLLDLVRTFEEAGVEFIGTPDDRPGVRRRMDNSLKQN